MECNYFYRRVQCSDTHVKRKGLLKIWTAKNPLKRRILAKDIFIVGNMAYYTSSDNATLWLVNGRWVIHHTRSAVDNNCTWWAIILCIISRRYSSGGAGGDIPHMPVIYFQYSNTSKPMCEKYIKTRGKQNPLITQCHMQCHKKADLMYVYNYVLSIKKW